MRYEAGGYVVVFADGRGFATNSDGVDGNAFFRKRLEAVEFKKLLAGHKVQTLVVKAHVTLETIE